MVTVYVTAPRGDAERLARGLVEHRLAACVNRIPCRSTYRWDEDIHADEESILLAKTTEDRYRELVEFVQQVHPYDVPCIERFDEVDVLASFADWRRTETAE